VATPAPRPRAYLTTALREAKSLIRKTKTRQPFPAAGRGTRTRKAPARITICGPLAA